MTERRNTKAKGIHNPSPFLLGETCPVCRGDLSNTEAGAGAVALASKHWVCMGCYRDEKKFKRWVEDQASLAAADDLFADF